jgi:hypothetical protein
VSVVLVIQHEICLSGSTIFSPLSHKRDEFRGKKVIEHKNVFLFSLQLLTEKFLILVKIEFS